MVGLVNIVLWVVFISISCGWFVVLIGMGVCSQSWIDLINVSLKLKMRMGYITNLYRTEHILERDAFLILCFNENETANKTKILICCKKVVRESQLRLIDNLKLIFDQLDDTKLIDESRLMTLDFRDVCTEVHTYKARC